jgi:hypothetical protein
MLTAKKTRLSPGLKGTTDVLNLCFTFTVVIFGDLSACVTPYVPDHFCLFPKHSGLQALLLQFFFDSQKKICQLI